MPLIQARWNPEASEQEIKAIEEFTEMVSSEWTNRDDIDYHNDQYNLEYDEYKDSWLELNPPERMDFFEAVDLAYQAYRDG